MDSTVKKTFGSLSAMLKEVLGERLRPTGDGFDGLLADDVVMEFPYSPPGPARVEGKAAVMEHQQMLGDRTTFDHMDEPTVYRTADPDVVVIEVDGHGAGVATGEPHDQHYVYVIRMRDGLIVHFKDYWNPLNYLKAL